MLTFSQSFKKTISKNTDKVSKIITNALTYAEYGQNLHNIIFKDSEVDYLTIRKNGMISYLPKGKTQEVNEFGEWKREGRQEARAGKVIRKLFNKKLLTLLKDSDIESFVNKYKATTDADGLAFQLLPSTEISNVYNMCEPDESEGKISSCMQGNSNEYFEIYENCEALQILVLTKHGQLYGRALIWTIGDKVIMDRIYVVKDFYNELFIEYAKENKMYHKKNYNSYNDKQIFIDCNGQQHNLKLTIKTDTYCDYFPYIDTFTYGGDGYLQNYSDGTIYEYTCTDGTREENYGVWDEIDGVYICEDDAVQITIGRNRRMYTHEANTVTTHSGEIVYRYDDDLIKIDGEYYHTNIDDVYYCEDIEEYQTEAILATIGKYKDSYISVENARRIVDDYCHIDDIEEC